MEKLNRTALYIYLPIDASKDEIKSAHDTIDNQFGISAAKVQAHVVSTTGTVAADETETEDTETDTTAEAGQLDKDGLPWDERIHSSNQKLTSAGTWWAKKGVDAAVKAKIEAELKACTTSTAVTAGPPTLNTAGNLPPMPGSNAAPQVDPAYAELVKIVADNMNSPANAAGRITADWLSQVLTHFQIPGGDLQNAAHAPQLVPPITAYLKEQLGL
jgi:hypothetical protein